MKPPKCRLCNALHWGNEPHVFATNKATNTIEVATNSATNKTSRLSRPNAGQEDKRGAGKEVRAGLAELPGQGIAGLGGVETAPRSANRRTREAYNAYQRDYMRKRRA